MAKPQTAKPTRGPNMDWQRYTQSQSCFLTQFDYTQIDNLDPTLRGQHALVYCKEVPLSLRFRRNDSAAEAIGKLEPIIIKIMIRGSPTCPEHVRVQLTSELDLYFQYIHEIDEVAYAAVQSEQKLLVGLADYTELIIKYLNEVLRDPTRYLAILVLHETGIARLDFVQNLNYKYVELLSVDFERDSEAQMRQQLDYRYQSLKNKLALTMARLSDLEHLLRIKNPALLDSLRPPQRKALRSGTDAITRRH